jgi:hypothetical protein
VGVISVLVVALLGSCSVGLNFLQHFKGKKKKKKKKPLKKVLTSSFFPLTSHNLLPQQSLALCIAVECGNFLPIPNKIGFL